MKKILFMLVALALAGCAAQQRPAKAPCVFKGQKAEPRAFLEQRGDVMVVVERMACR